LPNEINPNHQVKHRGRGTNRFVLVPNLDPDLLPSSFSLVSLPKRRNQDFLLLLTCDGSSTKAWPKDSAQETKICP
jgi:hypothetical protein